MIEGSHCICLSKHVLQTSLSINVLSGFMFRIFDYAIINVMKKTTTRSFFTMSYIVCVYH